eukprot:SAG31_NODE_2221_length_6156_cov_5.333994_8_plen_244_part_00
MNAPQTAALLWPPLLPLLALLLGPQASLGGGRCYTRLPPPPEVRLRYSRKMIRPQLSAAAPRCARGRENPGLIDYIHRALQYCKPHTTCATDNSTCPGCGAKFPPGCPCPPSKVYKYIYNYRSRGGVNLNLVNFCYPCPPSKEPFVPPPLPLRNFLSRTLGSNMVLQRAPQQAAVWGFAKAGTTVTTTMDALAPMLTKADSEGVWRQRLPATAGSTTTGKDCLLSRFVGLFLLNYGTDREIRD